MDSVSAQARAQRLQREARTHKRASQQHRRRAREKSEELRELIEACAAQGIQITITPSTHPTITEPKGGHSGNQNPQDQHAA